MSTCGNFKDEIKSMMAMPSRVASRDSRTINHRPGDANNNINPNENQFHISSLAVVCFILLVSCQLPAGLHCLEQDAAILEPVANIAKSVIKTVTLGSPLELHFDPGALVKNFAYFTWRTRFPVSMPRGFMQKTQDFYNRVKARVDQADVKDVQRKSLASLKLDLDKIVDSIVEEVRRSPDGLYTDYLQTRVDGVPIEDACTQVGIQLKAYGVDLTNYRNIAGMVLGVPLMPTVASTMVNVAGLANIDTIRNISSALNPLDSASFINQLPNSALQSVSTGLNTIDRFRQQLPMQDVVQTPFQLLSSGQRFLMPQAADTRQPVFA